MFAMMIALAIASSIVEMMFAASFPVWRRNAHRLKWVNMTISLILSAVLGVVFGAAGLIVMGAGMISTAMSIPGYAFLHWNYDTPYAQQFEGGLLKHNLAKWRVVISDFGKVLYKFLRVITFPIWGMRIIIQKYQNVKSKYNAYKLRRA